MIARWAMVATLVGCHHYSVRLEPTGDPPVPVELGERITVPSGILATAVVWVNRDGSLYEKAEVLIDTDNPFVIEVSPVDDGTPNEWAFLGVDLGETDVLVMVEGTHTFVHPTWVTEQPAL